MKFILFLVALANVGLFMWEYKQGAFDSLPDIVEPYVSPEQEQILLVGELNERLQAQSESKPERVAQTPEAEAMLTSAKDVQAADIEPLAEPLLAPAEADLTIASEQSAASNADQPVEQKKAEAGQKKAEPVQPPVVAASETRTIDNEKEPATCYEVGPFANGNAYQLWKKELNAPKEAIRSLSRDGEVINDYLVYYPAAETREQTDANLKMLKENGLTDLWALTKGKDSGLISLGVFKNESRALALRSHLLAKDIQAEIKPRYSIKPQKYAQIKAGGMVLERLNVMKQTYPAIAVKQISQCW